MSPIAAEPEAPQPLREIRRSRRLSQKDIADLIGTDQSTVSRLERGNLIPTRPQLARLAKALKCRPEDLFDRMTIAILVERQKATK